METPLKYNAAYRLPQEVSITFECVCGYLKKSIFNKSFSQQDVKYFTLKSTDDVVKLFKEELLQDHKLEEEEEDEEHWSDPGRMPPIAN